MTADYPAGSGASSTAVRGLAQRHGRMRHTVVSTGIPPWLSGSTAGAEEVKENNIAVWLTPAVNIHRNFPAEEILNTIRKIRCSPAKWAQPGRGIQSQHIAAAVKHFACNNKETQPRTATPASPSAHSAIYLKAFEIIVKEAIRGLSCPLTI